MNAFYDRETKKYLNALTIFAAVILCASVLLCLLYSAALRDVLLKNDRLIASALIAEGVEQSAMAEIFTNDAETEEGRSFIESIGLNEESFLGHFSAGSGFAAKTLISTVLVTALIIAAAGLITVRFFRRREDLFRQSAETLGRFVDGDYSKRLPRAETGGLYAMLSSADTLAMTLESRSEGERKAKESLREVISDISHQLKTPLAALRLYIDLMAEKADDANTVRSFTEKSALSIDRIEGLIQTLLKVMRLDTGNVEFHKETCRVSDLAAKATAELETRAAVEGKTLITRGDREEELYCDPQWTAEALMNLVKNALDYTDEGGKIIVSWEATPGMLRISVTDDGAGIAAEDMPFLFKRFYRSSKSRDIQGVGLGLPLTKSVTEGQGGLLSVKSQPDIGSQFTMTFLT